MKTFSRILAKSSLVLLCLMLSISISSAQDNYGAIYFSQVTGAQGYSFDYSQQQQAQQRALNECLNAGGTDCVRATWFKNACGALAVGNNNGWGAHWGNNRNGAEFNALKTCRQNTGGCKIVRWVCTAGAN